MRKNKKRTKLSKDKLKTAMAGLPRFIHTGKPPEALTKAFNRSYRSLATDPSKLSLKQKTLLRDGTNSSDERFQLFRDLPSWIIDGMNERTVLHHSPPWTAKTKLNSAKRFEVVWSRIFSTDVGSRTIYHWPSKPPVSINGGTYIAGFGTHAILRLSERLGLESTNSGRFMLVSLMRCPSIEIAGGGFWIWVPVVDGTVSALLARGLLVTEQPERYEFRLAYCPVEFLGKFAFAKTALSPAMRVDGINSSLVDPRALANANMRAWGEAEKLHNRLPLFRYVPKRGVDTDHAVMRRRDPEVYGKVFG